MTTLDLINKLNSDYSNRILKVSHSEYLKQFNTLKRKLKKERKPESLYDKVKKFGAKINRDKDSKGNSIPGYYIYKGKNFTVKFNSEECETKYWESIFIQMILILRLLKTSIDSITSIQN